MWTETQYSSDCLCWRLGQPDQLGSPDGAISQANPLRVLMWRTPTRGCSVSERPPISHTFHLVNLR